LKKVWGGGEKSEFLTGFTGGSEPERREEFHAESTKITDSRRRKEL
jgi:hypothetical protein